MMTDTMIVIVAMYIKVEITEIWLLFAEPRFVIVVILPLVVVVGLVFGFAQREICNSTSLNHHAVDLDV